MKTVLSDEARGNWRAVVDDVEHNGEHYEIRRYNRRSAMLVPAGWYDAAIATPDPGGKKFAEIPIIVDADEQPVSQDEIRETANRILDKEPMGDAILLAQLVLAWFDWKPEGWTPETPEEGQR